MQTYRPMNLPPGLQQQMLLDPRYRLSANLINEGSSTAPVQSWTQGLGRLAQALAGTYIGNKLQDEMQQRGQNYASTIADALKFGQGTPASTQTYGDGTTINWNANAPNKSAMLQQLASNPDTAPMAMQFQMADIQNGMKPEIFGSPVKAIGKDGKPVYVQVGSKGTLRPLEGYQPPPDKVVTPSTVQEWNYFTTLSPAEKEAYLTMKRANRPMDIGGSVIVPSMTQPGAVTGEIPKTLAPEQTPEVKGQQATAVDTAKAQVKKEELRPKAEAALTDLERKATFLNDTIDKALSVASNSSTATGWGNKLLGGLPNTDARALNNYLETIKANIGFDRLQQMRESSPTGGALGAVSEMENRLLQAVQGSLDPLQADQLVQNLGIIKKLYPQVLAERRAAFNKDYGDNHGAAPAAGNGTWSIQKVQ